MRDAIRGSTGAKAWKNCQCPTPNQPTSGGCPPARVVVSFSVGLVFHMGSMVTWGFFPLYVFIAHSAHSCLGGVYVGHSNVSLTGFLLCVPAAPLPLSPPAAPQAARAIPRAPRAPAPAARTIPGPRHPRRPARHCVSHCSRSFSGTGTSVSWSPEMLLDVHGHPPPDRSRLPGLLAALERWDSRLLLSDLGARDTGWVHVPEVRHWQEGNEQCAEVVRQHPDRLLGYCYVNPAHGREALAEMERRLLGEPETFGALKLWVAVRCSDPRLDPLMELCAAHDVPVLQHTWIKAGPQGPGSGNLAGESTPEDLLALARRHPRVRFFGGHIGGDWEWGVAALKQVDNVWLDVAGGDASGGYMEAALAGVGAGRIVYGTDVTGRSIPSQLAKILAVDLSEADREKILWQNAAHVLGKRLPPAWREAFVQKGRGAPPPASLPRPRGATWTPTPSWASGPGGA